MGQALTKTRAEKKSERAWSVRNEQIVIMATLGMKHHEIAEKFGMSASNVGNIVNDPRAEEIREHARARMRESLLDSIEDELDLAAKLSVKVLKKTLEADISPTHKAKANQDRVATKILAGRGMLRSEDRGGDAGGLSMSNDQFVRLMGALEKGKRVQEIDPFEGRVVEAEVEEGDDAGDS